jgi:hypothetical protein
MYRRILLLVVVLAIGTPWRAHALGEKAWLVFNSGGSMYSMSDLNDRIEITNAQSGTDFPLVKRGLSFGGAIGYDPSPLWSVGLGFERLLAGTQYTDSTSATEEYDLAANVWRVFAERGFNATQRSSLRLGLGVGIIAESGSISYSIPDYEPLKEKVTGQAPFFEAYGGAQWWANPRLALEGGAGYRRAKISELKIEGMTASGEPLDFSGPYLRLSVKLVAKGIE